MTLDTCISGQLGENDTILRNVRDMMPDGAMVLGQFEAFDFAGIRVTGFTIEVFFAGYHVDSSANRWQDAAEMASLRLADRLASAVR